MMSGADSDGRAGVVAAAAFDLTASTAFWAWALVNCITRGFDGEFVVA